MFSSRIIRVYIVPGAVFQSVMIGGGYGTGREIVEYFTRFGFVGGLMGMAVAFTSMAIVLSVSFELARRFQVFDYRNFIKLLLGKAWFAFEILIVLQFLLVLAVLASAAGNILSDHFGMPYGAGLIAMLVAVGILTFFGRDLIMRVLTFWSLFLYTVFLAFFIAIVSSDLVPTMQDLLETGSQEGWFWSGLKYAMYNLAAVPLLLYVTRSFKNRSEAIGSGVAAAAIAMIPAILFQYTFAGQIPAVLDQPIPAYWIMTKLGIPLLTLVYSVMLFGTFIETGAGMLQGINERIDAYLVEKRGSSLSRSAHAALAICSIGLSAILSLFGITSLIAKGYGTMAWAFFAIYLVPLITVGTWRAFSKRSTKAPL